MGRLQCKKTSERDCLTSFFSQGGSAQLVTANGRNLHFSALKHKSVVEICEKNHKRKIPKVG
jgi:hypothetical protein